MDERSPVARFELTPELLAAQGQALRRLARSLLGDAHAAEDVVQEAWIACLRRPGQLPERISAWLGAVTRRTALRRARDDGRRRAREGHAAVSERLEATPARGLEATPARGLEREEALRGVTLALLALDEPYKTALLLRYYEDRSPADIARELGVPIATVKSRLARGLDRLRESLGRELGDERRGRALALLAGVRLVPSPATSLTIGGLAMGAKVKVAAVAVLLSCGVLWMLGGERRTEGALAPVPEPESRSHSSSVASLVPAGSGEVEPSRQASARAPREAVPTASEESVGIAPLFPEEAGHVQRLRGRVRDAHDLPIAGAEILLATADLGFNLAARTDVEGRFALDFATRRPQMRCALNARDGEGAELGLCTLDFHAGEVTEVDLALGTLVLQEFRLELVVGQIELMDGSEQRFSLHRAGELTESVPEMATGPGGCKHFVEAWPTLGCPVNGAPPADASPVVSMVQGLQAHGALSFEGDGDLTLESLEASIDPLPTSGLASVRGIVRDPEGRLLAGVEVGYGPPGQGLSASTLSDKDGGFVLPDVPAGEWRLRVNGGAGRGRSDEIVTIADGESFSWNPLLDHGNALTGRLLLPDGAPLVQIELELWSTGPRLFRAVTRTNEDGRFAFEHLPDERFEMHVRSEQALFPVRLVPSLRAPMDLGTLTLQEEDLVRHTLRLALRDADGLPLDRAELRLWHVASGRGVVRRRLGAEGTMVCDGLPTGFYRVEVGGPLGWRELGTQWIDEDLDLGEVRFPRPGTLRLDYAPTPDALPVAFALWGAHADVFARIEMQPRLRSLLRAARPGDYALRLVGAAAGAELPVASGATTTLLLDGSRPPRLLAEPVAQGAPSDCRACHAEER